MLSHLPVLVRETVELLTPERGGRFLDGTFGGGGHSRALLEANEGIEVLALDCDPTAGERAAAFSQEYPNRFTFRALNFGELDTVPEDNFAGALFDFGVSSFQLDDAARGFSFRQEAPLDLRLNPEAGVPAAEFLEKADHEDLVRAIRDYGEEKRWRRLVDAIFLARGSGKLQTTNGFAELCQEHAEHSRGKRIHPATRAFQGVRIAVNDELGVIERGLPEAFKKLAPGGILAAISFHSLEDRIVKRLFNRLAGRPEHGRDSRPQDDRIRLAELVTRKPVVPSEVEISRNPRSRSARLRVLKKLAA